MSDTATETNCHETSEEIENAPFSDDGEREDFDRAENDVDYPEWLSDSDVSSDEEDVVSNFTSIILVDVHVNHIPFYCEQLSRGIEFNRKSPTVLACYALRRIPSPHQTEVLTTQTADQLRPNFITKSVPISREAFEESLNEKENFDLFQSYLSKGIYRTFPIFGTWRRCNGSYKVSCDPYSGDGTFFVMQKITIPHSNEQFEVAASTQNITTQIAAQTEFDQSESSAVRNVSEGDHAAAGGKVNYLVSKIKNISKKTLMEECGDCCCFEVLISDGLEQTSEVVIWASWVSKEAYLYHTQQKYATYISILVEKNGFVLETTFWLREDDGCLSLDAALAT